MKKIYKMDCGDCTVCCTLSVVKELNKKAWEQCSHCVNNGCEIYGKHPQVCKDFECAYLQGGNNIELRPDKCGVMFFKISDRIFTGALVPDTAITEIAKEQVNAFNTQGFSVVLLEKGQRPFLRLAKGHEKKDIYNEYLSNALNGNV